MKYKIALIGAGEIGSRHLQGLIKCHIPLKIFAIDPSDESLNKSKIRMNEVISSNSPHKIEFLNNHESLVGKNIDIVILSSSAKGRAELILDLSNRLNIRYWVLEKVLAQNEDELKKILNELTPYPGAWVNTPRRMMSWYKEIIKLSPSKAPLDCLVSGKEWGLACNAIHFLDLVAWWSGEQIQSISLENLAPKWHKSKRKGFWEIFGTLEAFYSRGSKLTMNCAQEDQKFLIHVNSGNFSWNINEYDGIAIRDDNLSLEGRLDFQSQITGILIESILEKGECELPCIETSVNQHKILLNALLYDWNNKMSEKHTKLPIT